MKREGAFKRPPISRDLRKKIEAEREWIRQLTATKRRLFVTAMEAAGRCLPRIQGVDVLGSTATKPSEPDGGEDGDDPYARFVPVGPLIDIQELYDAVSEDATHGAKGALK